jgi:hypothetical protein
MFLIIIALMKVVRNIEIGLCKSIVNPEMQEQQQLLLKK